MKTSSININLRVIFEYDETRNSIEDAIETAKSLAINPNYSTIEEGVRLIDHEINDLMEDEV